MVSWPLPLPSAGLGRGDVSEIPDDPAISSEGVGSSMFTEGIVGAYRLLRSSRMSMSMLEGMSGSWMVLGVLLEGTARMVSLC